ncbi:MAG TPA: class I SAM-dependent methyltransferase, partial [Pseudonocardia sp.]|nr:class I SAM-dependent methyltransferase [Pseudonocardia sp.]
NRGQQHEVLGLLGPPSAAALDVVEVGPGPGVLLGLLAARPDVRRVTGVEPSLDMRVLAVRHLAAGIAAGRVEVRAGDAAATGLPAASADLVVSVNTVAIWPDLDAGAAGLRRVLRPGGRLLLSWHGGREPARAARGLLLDEARLDRVQAALGERFAGVERVLTRRCTVFDARVAATG